MGTVADKLALLQNTKASIRQAIVAKGQSIEDTAPFSSYPEKIAAIKSAQPGIGTLVGYADNNITYTTVKNETTGFEGRVNIAKGGIKTLVPMAYSGSVKITGYGILEILSNNSAKVLEFNGNNARMFTAVYVTTFPKPTFNMTYTAEFNSTGNIVIKIKSNSKLNIAPAINNTLFLDSALFAILK